MNFDIKTEQLSDDAYVISLAGEVDLYTAPEFKQQLLEVIGQGGKQVIVDFSSTTFIDSTTLGVLVGGVKRLRTNDGQLSLVCSDRNITKIFEITGLDRVFAIYRRATRRSRSSTASPNRPDTDADPETEPTLNARRLLAVAALLLVAVAASGCGAVKRVTSGDPSQGKALFQVASAPPATRSRTPAPRARSGRTSTTRSRSDKAQGFSQQTMADIVRGQIAYPEPPMPANLVRGRTPTTSRCTSRSARPTRTAASPPRTRLRRPRRRRPRRPRAAAPRTPSASRSSPRPAAAAATR